MRMAMGFPFQLGTVLIRMAPFFQQIRIWRAMVSTKIAMVLTAMKISSLVFIPFGCFAVMMVGKVCGCRRRPTVRFSKDSRSIVIWTLNFGKQKRRRTFRLPPIRAKRSRCIFVKIRIVPLYRVKPMISALWCLPTIR